MGTLDENLHNLRILKVFGNNERKSHGNDGFSLFSKFIIGPPDAHQLFLDLRDFWSLAADRGKKK